MKQRSIVAALAACAIFSIACQPAGNGEARQAASSGVATTPGTGEVAARIAGVEITTDQIDQRAKEDLFARNAGSSSKLYDLRRATLDGMIEEQILEVLSEQRGTTPDELVAAEVEAMGPVTDDEAKAFFDENTSQLGGVSYEEVKPSILEFLGSRREQDAIARLREGTTVEILLERPRVQVADTGPSKGPDHAKVTIIEFSDFQCPFCQRVTPTIASILERYPNDVRIVYRNFPLGSHARAKPAAEAALCAAEQDTFWAYHDLLFENTRKLEDEDFATYASEVGLDTAAFQTCYEEGRFADQVERDMADGRAAGVTGTPAFFVNGVMLTGAKPTAAFYEVIDAELATN